MRVLVSALEPSANIHLKEVVKELPQDIELCGIFDKSVSQEYIPDFDITQMSVMGFVDAIKRLPFFLNLKKEMVKLSKECDKVLLMDSSGFNLPLAKAIKESYPNKKIIYYILPQAWAWKKGRIKKIEKYCDEILSILPFERDYYRDKQKIKYVGHPLLDEIKEFKSELTHSDKIAFLPGSRPQEISRLMPIFNEVSKSISNKKYILVMPSFLRDNSKESQEFIENNYGDISNYEVSFDAHQALLESEFAFICSGTATLEAALIGTPFILAYIANRVDFFIGSRLVDLNYVGLANIFFDKAKKDVMHPEFLQDEVTSKNLLTSYYEYKKDKFLSDSKYLRQYLAHGSSRDVAKSLLS
jgi:lipid-A-disaccharide synthase